MKQGWELKKINEVCEIRPPKKEAKELLSDNDLVSFVPMKTLGIDQKFFITNETKKLSDVSGSYTYFKNNDVLLAKITPCFENGKLGIASELYNAIGFGSSEFIVYRPSDKVVSEYLYYFLNQQSFRDRGKAVMTGAVGHKRIPKDFYEEFLIPIPPLEEQQQIVEILNEAFEAIEQAQTNINKNIENAQELFQSKLNDIFSQTGEGWAEKSLGDICENLDKKRKPITKNKRTSGEIPYYGASGIVDYVADHLFDEDLLLVSEDGANLLARTYPIAFSIFGKSWVNNHAHVLRFDNPTSQYFIEYYLNSIKLDDYVSGMAQPKLNQRNLNSIEVPSPSLEVQEKIVSKLNELVDFKKELEFRYKQKLNYLEDLKKSILQKAFAGELTNN